MHSHGSISSSTLQKETHIEPAIKKRSVSPGLGVYSADISSLEDLIGSTFLAEVASQPRQSL